MVCNERLGVARLCVELSKDIDFIACDNFLFPRSLFLFINGLLCLPLLLILFL